MGELADILRRLGLWFLGQVGATDDLNAAIALYRAGVEALRAGLMPAEQKPRLSAAEQQKLERWIKYSVFKIDPRNPDRGRTQPLLQHQKQHRSRRCPQRHPQSDLARPLADALRYGPVHPDSGEQQR